MENQEKTRRLLRRLRCHWQQKGRKGKQLVLLKIGKSSIQSSCWQADCCLWQKEQALDNSWQEENAAWWQELEVVLQEMFVWARVPEMVDTIVILEEDLVVNEQLEFPPLKDTELAQAVAWEKEQLIPGQADAYNTAYAIAAMDSSQVLVQLWAWPRTQVNLLGNLARGLHLCLRAIVVGMNKEQVQSAWYKGDSFKNWSLQEEHPWGLQQAEQLLHSHYPRRFFFGCLALSVGLYVVTQGACLVARKSLEQGEQELASYGVWQERMSQSQRLEQALASYRQLDKKVREQTTQVSGSVTRLGQSISVGCWLELLKGDAKSKEWQLEGACRQPELLNRLVNNLQQDPKLVQVRLQGSQQQGDKLAFSLLVKEK